MAKFALLLPREEMVEPARRIAANYRMEVVVCKAIITDETLRELENARRLGADIIVARGRQAMIIKENSTIPVVEIQFTGQEVALLLHRARGLVPHIPRPKIGVVTFRNMTGDFHYFEEVLGIDLHGYFPTGPADIEYHVNQAIEDDMDVILGGDFVNSYCMLRGKHTLFWDGTEDSIATSLRNARAVGYAADEEHQSNAHLQTLLDYSFGGILELDRNGYITQCNDMSCKLLGKAPQHLVGVRLDSLTKGGDRELLLEILQSGKEMFFSVLTVNNIAVVANVAPVVVNQTPDSFVFSFMELRRVEQHGEWISREVRYDNQHQPAGSFAQLHQSGREMQRAIKTARNLAPSTRPVLLCGEVGAGKGLFAQCIHNASACASGPFVTFACGGAEAAAAGEGMPDKVFAAAIRSAHNGTLFLSEVEQLSPTFQHTLWRLLREDAVRLSAVEQPTRVSVRVIAATAGDLQSLVDAGVFRKDLYYTLCAMKVEIPPLRMHPEDIEPALTGFFDQCVTRFSRYVVLTKEARQLLCQYDWPGNYLQLNAFLERLVLTAPSRTLRDDYVRQMVEQLAPARQPPTAAPADRPVSEVTELVALLERHGGSRSAAAAELGISKTTLWRRMKKLGIRSKYDNR